MNPSGDRQSDTWQVPPEIVLARILLLLMLVVGTEANAVLYFEYRDHFSAAERQRLERWVTEVAAAVEGLVGQYPFDVYIYFHLRRASEPVPWANTTRGYREGVHFHVDPRFSLEDFRHDWTAPHELSHLVIPYLGRAHAWFAEGLASYLQYQVMQQMGVLTAEQAAARYQQRFAAARRGYRDPEAPFVSVAPRLRSEGRYRSLYWGGAAYFLQVDRLLRAQSDTRLIDVLRNYLACCRRRAGLGTLLQSLDRNGGAGHFERQFLTFSVTPGFPEVGKIVPEQVDALADLAARR